MSVNVTDRLKNEIWTNSNGASWILMDMYRPDKGPVVTRVSSLSPGWERLDVSSNYRRATKTGHLALPGQMNICCAST